MSSFLKSLAEIVSLVRQGRRDVVENILKTNPRLATGKDEYGRTLLIDLVKYGDVALVSKLINQGADINQVDRTGNSPLHSTIWGALEGFETEEVLDLLLKAGANTEVVGQSGKTPLHLAIFHGLLPHAELLLRYRADPRATTEDFDKQTVVDIALKTKNSKAIELLRRFQA